MKRKAQKKCKRIKAKQNGKLNWNKYLNRMERELL